MWGCGKYIISELHSFAWQLFLLFLDQPECFWRPRYALGFFQLLGATGTAPCLACGDRLRALSTLFELPLTSALDSLLLADRNLYAVDLGPLASSLLLLLGLLGLGEPRSDGAAGVLIARIASVLG